MDWSHVRQPTVGRGRDDAEALELLETCWRMKGPRGRVLECGIYRTAAPGVEVRCGYGEDGLLRSQWAADIDRARELADEWRRAVLAKGGFEELSGE